MKILVCGGRNFNDADAIHRELNDAASHGPVHVISGAARGADTIARLWANDNNQKLTEFPALWRHHGKSAGPKRNQRMLDEGQPDCVLAFAGGINTQDMVTRARRAGVNVVDIRH